MTARKCIECGKVKPLSQFDKRGSGYFRTKCKNCFKIDQDRYRANGDPAAKKEYQDEYYKANGHIQRAKRVDKYHSYPAIREAVLTQSQLYYLNHKDAVDARNKKYKKKLKADVIAAYGGKCSCCGETESDFLTVEHIEKDGKEHRQRVSSVYRDLRDRGFPHNGYTIHCFNCNIAKSLFGVCPHRRHTRGK